MKRSTVSPVLGKQIMAGSTQILVDSDAFVGLLLKHDAHHKQVAELFTKLYETEYSVCTTTAVIDETATVLSHRVGQELACFFLDEVIAAGNFPTIMVTPKQRESALSLFKKQEKRGISMTDCINVAVMQELHITTIFSFDQFYSKRMGLSLASEISSLS